MAKKRNDRRGIVYSTDPDFQYQPDEDDQQETLEPGQQKLLVRIDRRQRKGKEVTLVEGFVGDADALKALGKRLKSLCGVGGAVKDGQILLQGDHRDKVLAALQKDGYGARRGN
jgi:translation initiation factor 1